MEFSLSEASEVVGNPVQVLSDSAQFKAPLPQLVENLVKVPASERLWE